MRIPQEPNRHTCPKIDLIQKTLSDIIKDFESFKETDEVNDFISSMSDSSWELKSIIDELEYLRCSNSDLRDWGQELTSCIEQLESQHQTELDELQDTISTKESEIEDLEERVGELEFKITG